MNESELNTKVVKTLNRFPGVFVKKRFAGPMQRGQLDITGIILTSSALGVRVELEGKLPGRKLTKIQTHWLKHWKEYGALTGVYHSVSEAIEIIEGFRDRYGSVVSL